MAGPVLSDPFFSLKVPAPVVWEGMDWCGPSGGAAVEGAPYSDFFGEFVHNRGRIRRSARRRTHRLLTGCGDFFLGSCARGRFAALTFGHCWNSGLQVALCTAGSRPRERERLPIRRAVVSKRAKLCTWRRAPLGHKTISLRSRLPTLSVLPYASPVHSGG